jgi:hypothetical protein
MANGVSVVGSREPESERRAQGPSAVPTLEGYVPQEGVPGHVSTLLQEQAERKIGDPPAGTRQAQEGPLAHRFIDASSAPPRLTLHRRMIAGRSAEEKASIWERGKNGCS